MSICFLDGKEKTYFGKDVVNSLSKDWGVGDVYSTLSVIGFQYSPVNVNNVLESVATEDNSMMFDTRVKEDSELNSLYMTLSKPERQKWGKIANAFKGKNVTIEYSDRYVLTPLGCMLLAHLIAGLTEKFEITIESLDNR